MSLEPPTVSEAQNAAPLTAPTVVDLMRIAGQRAMELGQIRGVLVEADPEAELPGYDHVMTVDVARAIVGQRDEAREALECATASYERVKAERDEAQILAAVTPRASSVERSEEELVEQMSRRLQQDFRLRIGPNTRKHVVDGQESIPLSLRECDDVARAAVTALRKVTP